jgi:threonine/homoserine/homoserine lactone efflux protein
MDPTAALIAGLAAGLAIAMQVGAVSLLLVETAVAGGLRVGVASGLGVATVDLLFAAAAVVAGATAGALLSEHEALIRLVAAGTLAAIALHGLAALRHRRAHSTPATTATPGASARSHYLRFVAVTLVNPLTIASFAAVATSLPLGSLSAATAFATGIGAASAGWHLVLTVAAGHAGRWITPRIQLRLAVGGRVAVLLIAAHLALGP